MRLALSFLRLHQMVTQSERSITSVLSLKLYCIVLYHAMDSEEIISLAEDVLEIDALTHVFC